MAKQPRNLVGQVAAVTGAARGIGKATAKALVREGMKVAIGDLDVDLARRAAGEIGGSTIALELNVTDRQSFERFVDEAEERLGGVDVLVNNAGIMPIGRFLEEDDLAARRQLDINVHGVLHGMKIVLPRMLERGRGHVVNLASSAGKAGFPGVATYSGTKHFVVGVSEAVRAELRGTPVELTIVLPGVVDTELMAGVEASRGVRKVSAHDVADAIVDALRAPRFEVYVPPSIGPLARLATVLPRGGRELIVRAVKGDRILADADARARRGYEWRAAHSEPGLEPAQPEPLTEVRR